VPTDQERDEARAKLLAEFARQLLLWLRDNELPGATGVKGRPPQDFRIFAGVYRKLLTAEAIIRGGKVIQFWDRPGEVDRLRRLGLGATHVLLRNPGEATGGFYWNEMFLADDKTLEDEGGVGVHNPVLDSAIADLDTLGYFHYFSFTGLRDKADMVYDDPREAQRIKVAKPLRWIFDEEAPREAYRKNVRDIIQVPGMGFEEFRHYLYWFATYENRVYVREKGGDYYGKWDARSPLDPRDRVYVPTKLSPTYLRESFYEYVLKKGEDYLLIKLPGAQLLYRLVMREVKGKRTKQLQPKLILRFQNVLADPGQEITPPIDAIVFHALDGGSQLPSPLGKRGEIDLAGVPSGRVAYNYKAAVRWFFDPEDYDASSDQQWFTTFVDMLFPDAVYPVSGTHPHAALSSLSIDELVAQAEVTEGPLKDQLAAMQRLARDNPSVRFVVKGALYGATHANRRQLIGVSKDQVYEWYPETSLVTRMDLADWYTDNYQGQLFTRVYENTKGMIPFILVVTFGGVAVAGGAVIGAGAALGTIARTAIKDFVADQAAKKVTRELVERFRSQLVALLADGILKLLPQTNDVTFEFFRGFVHGYGAGAIEHYLGEVDDRFEKQAKKLYNKTISRATKGISRVYQVYMKLSAAYHKLTGLFRALRAVWTAARARAAAEALGLLGKNVGLGFLIGLFVVVYVDYVYRGGKADKKARDEWVKAQCELLQLMLKETGDDLVAYAKALREDLNTSNPDRDAIRKRNDALAAKIADAVVKAPTAAPSVAEILRQLLAELGVKNIDELIELGLFEVLCRGFQATLANRPGLAADQARALGGAVGELIGTIFLERAVLPAKWRKGPVTGHRDVDAAIRKTLAGGTGKAIWELAKFPIDQLKKTLSAIAKDLKQPPSDTPDLFERVKHGETWYRDTLRDLFGAEADLAATTATLAADETLQTRLQAVTARAQTELPPDIETLLENDDPLWPRDTMVFVLGTWLRVGLLQLRSAFEVLEDTEPYAGDFKLATLLEIGGLQVSLDDKTAQALRVTFERATR
jgi:hypothetical protein